MDLGIFFTHFSTNFLLKNYFNYERRERGIESKHYLQRWHQHFRLELIFKKILTGIIGD